MLEWLLNLIGISDTLIERLSEAQWVWSRPGFFWAGVVLLTPAAVLIARRHRASLGHLSPLQRTTLTSCRVGILAVLVFVLGAPYLRLEQEIEQAPVVAMLIDDSASMDLPIGAVAPEQQRDLARVAGLIDGSNATAESGNAANGDGSENGHQATPLDAETRRALDQLTRRELLIRVLRRHEQNGLLEALDERFELRPYRFARHAEPTTLTAVLDEASNVSDASEEVSDDESDDAVDRASGRDATALGAALETVIGDVAGRDLVGLIVFSDGQSNTGPGAAEIAEGIGSQGISPVWAVPVGGAQPIEDVAIIEAVAPSRVAPGDSVRVSGRLLAHGFAEQEVRVVLREGEEIVDEASVYLDDAQSQPVELTFTAEEAGTRLLELAIEPPDGDRVENNNRMPVSITVDDQRWKVLYLDGYPRWDFRFLDHTLRRSQSLDVTMVLESELAVAQTGDGEADEEEASEGESGADSGESTGDDELGAGNESEPARLADLAGLPETAEALAEYDVVMLGDVSPRLADVRFLEQLKRAVQSEGVGLLVQGGPQHMPARFADGPLAELLPVEVNAEDAANADGTTGIEAEAYSPFTMAVTAAGAMHPAFELYDRPSRNRQLWSQMPSFFWAADFGEPKPGATVLAERAAAGGDAPLIVEHFAGAGRVLVVGTDTTYRWRRNIGDHLFHRFWAQTLRHVAGSRGQDSESSWIRVSPAHLKPGEPVSIEVYAIDENQAGLDTETVNVKVFTDETTDTITLHRTDSHSHYRGQWTPPGEGNYQLTYEEPAGEQSVARVRVIGDTQELARVAIDRDSLGELGDVSGGGLLELTRLDRLDELLEGESITVNVVREQEVWDNWLVLMILISLYCLDVFVRRLAGMT